VTYNKQGEVLHWRWGELSIDQSYDEKLGHMTERKLGQKATYRYLYKGSTKVGHFSLMYS